MTGYEEACARACPEGCGKGLARYSNFVGVRWMHFDSKGHFACTADKVGTLAEYAEQEHQQRLILERALQNVFMAARRGKLISKTAKEIALWTHIIRFCDEAGLKSSPLRESETEEHV